MDAKRILKYLRQLMANNNRAWYLEHKKEYDIIRADFEAGVQQAIGRIMTFDESIAHLTVKDCTYRFNRDTRFSNDKSPYKNHLGAYIAAHGKKALHGGYYLHLEPGHCLVACGNYWLPTNILTRSCGCPCRYGYMGPAPGLRLRASEDLPLRLPPRLGACGLPAPEGLLLLASGG